MITEIEWYEPWKFEKSQAVIKFGIEVKRLRCLPVTEFGAGSTPVIPAFLYGVMVTHLFLVQIF